MPHPEPDPAHPPRTGPRASRGLRRLRRAAPGLVALALLQGSGCRGPEAPDALDRETFIEVWVELRSAAAGTTGAVSDRDRARILEARGVSEDELVRFVEVHGDESEYMSALWNEVLERLEQGAPPPDTSNEIPSRTERSG
jgi:hypothetical protein